MKRVLLYICARFCETRAARARNAARRHSERAGKILLNLGLRT